VKQTYKEKRVMPITVTPELQVSQDYVDGWNDAIAAVNDRLGTVEGAAVSFGTRVQDGRPMISWLEANLSSNPKLIRLEAKPIPIPDASAFCACCHYLFSHLGPMATFLAGTEGSPEGFICKSCAYGIDPDLAVSTYAEGDTSTSVITIPAPRS
jgi:hypothetical protein